MIIFSKEFTTVSDCVDAIRSTGLRFADKFTEVETFDEFTNRCIDIFQEYRVDTDSIYYNPNSRFNLNMNKFGTYISFGNNTSIGISIINPDNPIRYKVEITLYMPADRVFRSPEYQRLLKLEWAITNTEISKTKSKSTTFKKKGDLERINDNSLQDLTELTEKQRFKLSGPIDSMN